MMVGVAPQFEVVEVATKLARRLAEDAAARDQAGGTATEQLQWIRESGLLGLRIPREYGGLGADWRTTNDVIRIVAQADSSLAHILAWHQLEVVTPELIGSAEQAA